MAHEEIGGERLLCHLVLRTQNGSQNRVLAIIRIVIVRVVRERVVTITRHGATSGVGCNVNIPSDSTWCGGCAGGVGFFHEMPT